VLRAGPGRARRAALVAPVLVLLQIGLGAWTVWSLVSVPVVSLHLGVGALLLADALLLHFLGGPVPAPVRAGEGRLPGLAHAAG
jgi:heme A synthase